MSDLGQRLLDASYLEGDFLLRSGRRSKFYLDKYLFSTQPDLLRDIAAGLAQKLPAYEPFDRVEELGRLNPQIVSCIRKPVSVETLGRCLQDLARGFTPT